MSSSLVKRELFLLELWREDCLSCVRALSPVGASLEQDDGLAQLVMQFSMAIKDLVDWESERVTYKDSDGDEVHIDGISGDGFMESVLDAAAHWPFVYKVQYEIVQRPRKLRSPEAQEIFPDVTFPELCCRSMSPPMPVVEMFETRMETASSVPSTDCFHDFLLELEKRQDDIQHTLGMSEREFVSSLTPAIPLSPVPFAEMATEETRRRGGVPGTPREGYSPRDMCDEPELEHLVERVERQLSRMNSGGETASNGSQIVEWHDTVGERADYAEDEEEAGDGAERRERRECEIETAEEDQLVPASLPVAPAIPTTPPVGAPVAKRETRITRFKQLQQHVEAKGRQKRNSDPKVALLKMGRLRFSEEDSDEGTKMYTQSIRVINLSRNPINAKINIIRRSTGARGVLERDCVLLQPFCPTKFIVGLADVGNDETSFVTFSLYLFNAPVSPPFTLFAPVRAAALVAPPTAPRPPPLPALKQIGAAPLEACSFGAPAPSCAVAAPPLPPAFPELEAAPKPGAITFPPRLPALPPPPTFDSITLKNMIAGRKDNNEDEVEEPAASAPGTIENAERAAEEEHVKRLEEKREKEDYIREEIAKLVEQVVENAEKERDEPKSAPMFIIEETAEDIPPESEMKEEEKEEEEEVVAEEKEKRAAENKREDELEVPADPADTTSDDDADDEVDELRLSETCEVVYQDELADSESDSEYEVISSIEATADHEETTSA